MCIDTEEVIEFEAADRIGRVVVPNDNLTFFGGPSDFHRILLLIFRFVVKAYVTELKIDN